MSVLSGSMIRQRQIIVPHFSRKNVTYGENKFTFGEGPAGYDVRVEFARNTTDGIGMQLSPNGFMLASTMEEFFMPPDVIGFVCDKSSWIRRGLSVHNTVIEPGWHGFLTLELKNVGHDCISIFEGSPIAQVIFHEVVGTVNPYNGKYQDQERGPQSAR